MNKYKIKKKIRTFTYHFFVLTVALLMLYPVIWLVVSSFKTENKIFTNAASLIPNNFTLDNYVQGWKGFGGVTFSTFFKNSILLTGITVIGQVTASALVAYGFGRINFKGKKILFSFMIITMLLPTQILTIPQYIMFQKMDWLNTYLPMIVPAFAGLPFFIFLIIQFIRGIPKALDESAFIDGCGKGQTWHFNREKNGGLVVDLMVHDFDLLRWLTESEVEESIGYIQQGNVEGFVNFLDDAKILVKMKNQITACLQTDWWTPNAYWTYGEGCIICTGTKGRCVVHTTGSQLLHRKSSFCVLTKDNKEEEILENRKNNLNVTDDFLNRIHGGVGMISHSDILKATKASLEADQTVTVIKKAAPLL